METKTKIAGIEFNSFVLNASGVNDSTLEELEEIVNKFNETVTEIKPPLESKLINTQTFIKDVMVRGLQNYQNIIEDNQENLDNFYQDNLNSLIEEKKENISTEVDEVSSDIENLTLNYQKIINVIEETLKEFYDNNSSELKEKYQELFQFIEDELIENLMSHEEKINYEGNNLRENIINLLDNYSEINQNSESLIDVFEKLIN